MRYRTIFTVHMELDGPDVDAMYVVDMERLAVAQATNRLMGGAADPYPANVHSDLFGIELRSRYSTGGGPYNLHTDTKLSRDDLDTLLKDYARRGKLRDFLKQAKT